MRKSAPAHQPAARNRFQKTRQGRKHSTFKKSTIINSDLVLVESTRAKIFMNRPLIVGFTILEMAKLLMYRFYYEALLPKYSDKMRLLFTDTDSFILLVETPNLHANMASMTISLVETYSSHIFVNIEEILYYVNDRILDKP